MIRDLYNYLRWGVSRSNAEQGMQDALADVVMWSERPPPATSTVSGALCYADGIGIVYPDICVRYVPQFMMLHDDTNSEVIIRALNLVIDNARRAHRLAPETTRTALIQCVPFADQFSHLKGVLRLTMERINPDPAYWQEGPARPAASLTPGVALG